MGRTPGFNQRLMVAAAFLIHPPPQMGSGHGWMGGWMDGKYSRSIHTVWVNWGLDAFRPEVPPSRVCVRGWGKVSELWKLAEGRGEGGMEGGGWRVEG